MDTKLEKLRKVLDEHNVHAFIINSSDPHMSEIPATHWQARKWISGFTGSAGVFVITRNKAGLWTDSRYFIQAENQLNGTGIELFKQATVGTPSPTQWLKKELEPNCIVGLDGSCFSVSEIRSMKSSLGEKGIKIVSDDQIIDQAWIDRPSIPQEKAFELDVKFSGKSRFSKLTQIRKFMNKYDCNYHLVSSLDDIAWILNIRGNDIINSPLLISYLLISDNNSVLYTDTDKINDDLLKKFSNDNIYVQHYSNIFKDLEDIPKSSNLLLNTNKCNWKIFNSISSNVLEGENPSEILKSCKNEIEVEGFKNAMKKDGIALTKFFFWLENNIEKININESLIAEKLIEFRSMQQDFHSVSFDSIVAYKENGALPHYSTTAQTEKELKKDGFLLIDSGAQYFDGTTDITRTINLGNASDKMKEDFTIVLKAMINLSMAVFPVNTTGSNIDVIARLPLWKSLRNYGHGTGHGVGHFLNVHEGPQSIRQEYKDQYIKQGMITSNEPALYRENEYGIRHENLILCKDFGSSEFGDFLEFETLTICYFDSSAIELKLLNDEELNWLNDYHQKVYDCLSSELDEDEKEWLKIKTTKLVR
ncbi:MAG: aminopeptidase P family N-terminal domain-containing protein [Marinifilaceae bacterium]|jgi:Xaa-Pro aminopeptidase|nr:aminopeptidase P family N-terminal domain-containing protein [Marinifilaceae bacterium]